MTLWKGKFGSGNLEWEIRREDSGSEIWRKMLEGQFGKEKVGRGNSDGENPEGRLMCNDKFGRRNFEGELWKENFERTDSEWKVH